MEHGVGLLLLFLSLVMTLMAATWFAVLIAEMFIHTTR